MSLDISKVAQAFNIDDKDIDYIMLRKGKDAYKFIMYGGFKGELPLDFSKYDNYYIHLKDNWIIFKKDIERKQKELEKKYGFYRQVSE